MLSILCLIALLAACSVHGQDENTIPQFPEAMEGVEVGSYYPEYPDQKLPIGEVITVLCYFTNNADVPLNVSAIKATLNQPTDFSYYIQDYRPKEYGIEVEPNQEITLDYQFMLHPDLKPEDYVVAATVFYNDPEAMYSSTFFNQTIESYRLHGDWGPLAVVQLICGIVSSVITCFLLWIICGPDNTKKTEPHKLEVLVSSLLHGTTGEGNGRKKATKVSESWVEK